MTKRRVKLRRRTNRTEKSEPHNKQTLKRWSKVEWTSWKRNREWREEWAGNGAEVYICWNYWNCWSCWSCRRFSKRENLLEQASGSHAQLRKHGERERERGDCTGCTDAVCVPCSSSSSSSPSSPSSPSSDTMLLQCYWPACLSLCQKTVSRQCQIQKQIIGWEIGK